MQDSTKTTQQSDICQSTSASEPAPESPARPKKAFTGVRASKFRHLLGTPMHKSNNIENVRNLSISLPGDSDAFQVNQEFAVFPLSGPGGQIAVVPVSHNLLLRERSTGVCESLTVNQKLDVPFTALILFPTKNWRTVVLVPDSDCSSLPM